MSTPAVTGAGVATVVSLVILSAFFSSSETAIFTLPEAWFDEQEGSADPRMATLQDLRADPHRLLVTILVGNNVVNVAIASITTVLLIEVLPAGAAVTLATVLASFVVLVFGEIVPKSYGLGNASGWALRVATPIAVVERVLYPLVIVFDVITRSLNDRLGAQSDIETSYVEE